MCAILGPRQVGKTTLAKAELDLLLIINGKKIGFEFKYTDAPKLTPSMRIAHEDLNLNHLYVIHPGSATFPLAEKTTAYGLKDFLETSITDHQ